jgi:hypothetical protein
VLGVMLLTTHALADDKILKELKAPAGFEMTVFAAPPR